jgi:hypothetical protein
MFRHLAVMILTAAACGCNSIMAPCDTSRKAGIVLTVLDSATHGHVPADSIIVIARDGGYADSVRFTNVRPDPVTDVPLAYERAGEYDIEVRATGYAPWSQANIQVHGGRCHVGTVTRQALLQRVIA